MVRFRFRVRVRLRVRLRLRLRAFVPWVGCHGIYISRAMVYIYIYISRTMGRLPVCAARCSGVPRKTNWAITRLVRVRAGKG